MARPADLSSRPKISLPVSTTWSVSTARDTIHAARVVLALPLRLAAWLSVPVADVPSWLAGQAKLVAAYPAPFWRAEVLNGDAISHRGPLAEILDASPADAGTVTRFGFAHPGAARQPGFRDAALGRLFGAEATTPDEVIKSARRPTLVARQRRTGVLMHVTDSSPKRTQGRRRAVSREVL